MGHNGLQIIQHSLGEPPWHHNLVRPDRSSTHADNSQEEEFLSTYEEVRTKYRELYQTLMGEIFEVHQLPWAKGIDIGSGPNGEMVSDLLAPFITKEGWIQIEIDSDAVDRNKSKNPELDIRQGSYLDMVHLRAEGKQEIITGLSALSATDEVPAAITQIAGLLEQNGYFLHLQDRNPGISEYAKNLRLVSTDKHSKMELFRIALGQAIKDNSSFEPIFNDWFTVVQNSSPILNKNEFEAWKRSFRRETSAIERYSAWIESVENVFKGSPDPHITVTAPFGIYIYGDTIHLHDLPNTAISMVVTLAKKK